MQSARAPVARGARPERGAHICSRPRFEDDADARVAERRLAGARRRGADARRTTGGARTIKGVARPARRRAARDKSGRRRRVAPRGAFC